MEAMATSKKPKARGSAPRPDRYSKARSGLVKTGIRLDASLNKLLIQAAELEMLSLNSWMTRVLVAAAKKRISQEPTQ